MRRLKARLELLGVDYAGRTTQAALVELLPRPPDGLQLSASQAAALARLQDVGVDHFYGFGALFDSVECGAIAPLRGRYLIALHRRGGRIRRRQDLPAEAFWTADELRRVCARLDEKGQGQCKGLLFVALSYRWLARGEPDPDGFHLGIVASVLDKLLDPKDPDTGEPEPYYSNFAAAFHLAGLGEADCAVFWDCAR